MKINLNQYIDNDYYNSNICIYHYYIILEGVTYYSNQHHGRSCVLPSNANVCL